MEHIPITAAEEKEESKSKIDKLENTQGNQFTSEIYKIEVRNLGIFGIGEFKKLIRNQCNLNASKIKSPKLRDFAYVCFRSKEDQEKAIEKLNGYRWKGKELKAMLAKATPDPLIKRRSERTDVDSNKKKKTSVEATCPLAHMTYDQQLNHKRSETEDLLRLFGNELKKINFHFKKLLPISADLPCQFLGIRPSPVIEGYRNKSEFSIGKNSDGKIVVGFRLGSYADGSLEVGSLEGVNVIPETAKLAAKSFEEYLSSTKFEIFNPDGNKGHFKQLTVRTSKIKDEIMIVVGVYSDNLKAEEVEDLKIELKEFYNNYDKFKCSSLYYQDLKRRDAGQTFNPVVHLSGLTHINDIIHGLKFRISPLAFFQINTSGAEVLYQEAIDLAKANKKTTVLDICCGTGTIGLCFAKHCQKVLGVEIIPEAIEDAYFNANENNIENCTFFSGNADDYIQYMVRETVYEATRKEDLDIVAIVDPPRAGLHTRSIQSLRSAESIDRLVYISCDPKSAKRNWIDLGRPISKQYKGEPFFPKKAVVVDMFPQTFHKEVIILFERMKNWKKGDNDSASSNLETKSIIVEELTDEKSRCESLTKESIAIYE